jgi:cytochrome c-type biogenesis protein CcmF
MSPNENPIATVGNVGLLISLVAAAYAVMASVAGARRGDRRLERSGLYASYASTAFVSCSSAIMFFLLLSSDYSVKYVQMHSDASMPWIYKLTSFWGGLEGSIVWWALLLALFSSIAIFLNRERHKELLPYVIATLYTVLAFFLLLIIFMKRPFDLYLTEIPTVGKGLNPLLQNPYMATHPPSLYLGFVAATVPFAFGMAALITGNLDDSWLASTRRWMMVSWFFLSQGLILGSLWAYEELGWGGYWGWDPVENAGFLPWLTATAFLHSIMVQERRGMMKVWNVSLVIVTFILTMIGTFMTRSGIVQSVHAFGQDNVLAVVFLVFISATLIFAFGMVIHRLPLLRSRNELDSWLSREFAFLVNNWILLSAALFILVATLFPTLSEWVTGQRITVGAPFFTKWMAPIGLVLLFLTGVGPLIAWRSASSENLREQFTFPGIAFFAMLLGLQAFPGLRGWSLWTVRGVHIGLPITAGVLCFGLCAFVTATIGQEFYRGTRVRQEHTGLDFFTSLIGLVARGKRRYGGYIVHIAIVLMFIGFAGDAYKRETDATLAVGKTVTLGHYTVRFDGLEHTSDPEKDMMAGVMTVTRDGALYATMRPAKWAYVHHEDEPPTSEVAINKTLSEDLYIVMNGFETKPVEMANIKVVINPLVDWIWLGFLLLAAGTFIAYLPDRAYALAAARAPTPGKAAAAAIVLLLAMGGSARAQEHPQQMQAAESGTDLHMARDDHDRAIFNKLKCTCPDCAHSLNECGGECGLGARRRAEVQQLISQGMTDDQIMSWQLNKYGQQVLRVPLDTGFNRLAWLFPYAITLGGVGGLVFLARRVGRKHMDSAAPAVASEEPKAASVSEEEKALNERLDDELDELD